MRKSDIDYNMSKVLFSIEYLENAAKSLVYKLNRKNIFPPLINDPEMIISKRRKTNKIRKRTPNSFIICRLNVHNEVMRKGLNANMRIISKTTSLLWKNASSNEKYEYTKLAELIKKYSEIKNNQESNNVFNHYHSFHLNESHNSITEKLTDEEFKENYFNSNFNSSFLEDLTFSQFNDLFVNFNDFLF